MDEDERVWVSGRICQSSYKGVEASVLLSVGCFRWFEVEVGL